MFSKLACLSLAAITCVPAFAQTTPHFEIADVRVTPKVEANNYMQANPPRNGRYEFHSASMIDLIRLAYAVDEDKILGGPGWLEMDRFEVIAQVPPGTTSTPPPGASPGTLPTTVREMLQSLLADRFSLKARQENKPLAGYALTVERKPQMKEADGTGDTGCRYMPPSDPADTTTRFACRNMTMDAFTAFLPRLIPTPSGQIIDKTEMNGSWNFELRYARNETPASAIEKQLGLKLEPQQIPTPVVSVASASKTPTPNDPRVAEALPLAPQPIAFDVASMKPTDPAYPNSTILLNPQPGGIWSSRGVLLSGLIVRAFSPSFAQRNEDLIVGMPDWARTTRFDITARPPADASASARTGPMVKSLLEERLKLKWHTEERPVSVFVLVPAKPKMKQADPASRAHCQQVAPPAGSPPGTASMACQNTTMEQFAEAIRPRMQGPGSPVLDATGLEGGWDFTLTYLNPRAGTPASSDPDGGLTLAEAIEKQLGLKLGTQKRPMTVTVIDHIEQTPTDN